MSGKPPGELRSMTVVPPSRYLVFVAIASVGCYLDLASKRMVFQWLGMPGQQPIWWVWPGIFGVETSLNTGALFGLGTDRVILFAVLSGLALVGIMIWFVFGRIGNDLPLTITFGCITAGIMGNLYDRLGLWSIGPDGQPQIHAVRDWIRFSLGELVWPNFNIADSLLVCSAAFLMWRSFQRHEPTASAVPPRSSAPVPAGSERQEVGRRRGGDSRS